jgi:3-oxoacyl-[acyl-carrier protein] reductase
MTRKVAIITGGATGVGAAVACLLAARSYDVLVNYSRSAEAAAGVVQQCLAAGVDAVAVQGDVANDADCKALARQAMERWGRIDALVCSAGASRFIPMADLDAVTTADFERAYAVNSIGPFQMARAVQPHMQGGGAIVNVSSIAGVTGSGSSFPYVLSKAALNILTVALARNLAPAIRVNAVLPGFIEGRWVRNGLGTDEAYERVKGQYAATAALGKVSKPEQIASAVCWLLEDDSAVTGQLIPVDAGFMLGKPPSAAGATR